MTKNTCWNPELTKRLRVQERPERNVSVSIFWLKQGDNDVDNASKTWGQIAVLFFVALFCWILALIQCVQQLICLTHRVCMLCFHVFDGIVIPILLG